MFFSNKSSLIRKSNSADVRGRIPTFKPKRSTKFPKKFVSDKSDFNIDNIDSNINSPHLSSQYPTAPSVISNLQPPVQIIKFGNNSNNDNEAPVALCIHENGNGYARWSAGGPVACNMESGKIFAQYRGGSIACVLDSAGSGSVMDLKGKCVLIINENGSAKVLDRQGIPIATYYKDENNPLNIDTTTKKKNLHSWNFDSLLIEFYPKSWELKLKVKSEKVLCEFSNIAGVKLLEEIGTTSPMRRRKKKELSHDLSNDEHNEVRSNIQDIISNCDELISGLK
jgi:hypothetical protein